MDRFYFINSCIFIDIEAAQESISKVTDFYTPTNIIAIHSDETIIESHQAYSPHRMHIPGKDHPDGILFTTAADSNSVMTVVANRNRKN